MNNEVKEAKGFFIFFGDVALLDRLTDEEKGQMFNALIEYALYGRVPNYIDRYRSLVFDTFAKKIDSYYATRGLSRPAPKTVEEPIDKELAFDESKLTRIKVYNKAL